MFLVVVLLSPVLHVIAEVIHVQVIFRHGDRAPSDVYPLDPYGEEVWPRGFSQLTEKGYKRAQQLGKYLRIRYRTQHSLLGQKFENRKIFVRSSDKDRCIETAMGVISTLFPGEIVPIHTYSSHKYDLLLKPSSVRCDRANILVSGDKRKLYQKRDREYKNLFAYLSQHTGTHVSMSNIKNIYNIVHRESESGLKQPAWVYEMTGRNTTVIEEMAELKRQERIEAYNSFEKAKLSTGFLTGQLLKELQDKVLGISRKSMALYSTHDATITSLLYNFGVSNHLLPPYTTAVLLELHKINEQHFVKVLLRNSTEEALPLQLPSCAVLCPWEEFVHFVTPRSFRTREEFEIACENRRDSRRTYPKLKTLSALLLGPELVAVAGYSLLLFVVMYLYKTLPSKDFTAS